MYLDDLKELLLEMAIEDLYDDADLNDHPCVVAIRAINGLYDDATFLVRVANGKANRDSKRAQTLRVMGVRKFF